MNGTDREDQEQAAATSAARRRPSGRQRARRLAVRTVAFGLVLFLIVWANIYAAEHDLARDMARRFGYAGIFLGAAASGFNLVVPIPMVAFFPFFMEAGFDRVLTVVVIAVGMTTGDLVGYLLGRTTREVFAPRVGGTMARLERLREQHRVLPFIVMFVYAALAPLPNEVLVIPLAFLRYPVLGIFTAVLGGNLIFNSLFAFGVIRVFAGF